MTDVLDGITTSDPRGTGMDAERNAARERLTASLVRRVALRHHPCQAGCLHRNHRRDKAHVLFLCDMLDVPPDPARPEDYEGKLAWTSVSRAEAAELGRR